MFVLYINTYIYLLYVFVCNHMPIKCIIVLVNNIICCLMLSNIMYTIPIERPKLQLIIWNDFYLSVAKARERSLNKNLN